MIAVTTKPDPYEPYLLSQAVKAGPFVFVSGQAGYDASGRIVDGGFLPQGHQAFRNLDRALRAAGSSLSQVAKVTIFVTDMRHFRDVVELRREYFSKPYPADSIVEVKALYAPEAMIEIEAIALPG
ncbi:MAG: RidA family protein [Gammaproteobacteria bacterium]|nr:RidA family protein [Gammaproteobacteria bacterium]